MRTIFFLKGIPASGKSRWAEYQIKKYPNRFKRVNKDLIRKMLDDGKFSVTNEKIVVRLRDNIIESSLRSGYDVIVDDTNFSDKHWHRICEIAENVGDVKVIEKFFAILINKALSNNENRNDVVPVSTIRSMYDKHVKDKQIFVREEYFPPINEIKYDQNKKDAIIVDIDGTIAYNNGHRNHYDPTKVIDDSPVFPIIDLIQTYENGFNTYTRDLNDKLNIILVSGRDESSRIDTETWLDMYNFKYNKLFMRNDDDRRPDYVIKKEIYNKFIKPHYNIKFVLDDRNQIVKMWRGIGLTTLQVNFGDF